MRRVCQSLVEEGSEGRCTDATKYPPLVEHRRSRLPPSRLASWSLVPVFSVLVRPPRRGPEMDPQRGPAARTAAWGAREGCAGPVAAPGCHGARAARGPVRGWRIKSKPSLVEERRLMDAGKVEKSLGLSPIGERASPSPLGVVRARRALSRQPSRWPLPRVKTRVQRCLSVGLGRARALRPRLTTWAESNGVQV